MLVAYAALLVCLVGGVIYIVASNGKVQELARGAYWVGLFWTVAAVAQHSVKLAGWSWPNWDHVRIILNAIALA